jgi:hypothetical protein
MEIHCPLAYVQSVGHFFAGSAFNDEKQHFQFALCQPYGAIRLDFRKADSRHIALLSLLAAQ